MSCISDTDYMKKVLCLIIHCIILWVLIKFYCLWSHKVIMCIHTLSLQLTQLKLKHKMIQKAEIWTLFHVPKRAHAKQWSKYPLQFTRNLLSISLHDDHSLYTLTVSGVRLFDIWRRDMQYYIKQRALIYYLRLVSRDFQDSCFQMFWQ